MFKVQSVESRSMLVAFASILCMSVLLVGLLARVAQLQLRPSPRLQEQLSDRVSFVKDAALRGKIVDRAGRSVALTRFGYRVVVDPTLLDRENLDANIVRLADAMGVGPDFVGERINRALQVNAERIAPAKTTTDKGVDLKGFFASLTDGAPKAAEPSTAGEIVDDKEKPGPIRYLAIGERLADERVAGVRALKIRGLALEQRPVREYPSGTIAASIIGLTGVDDHPPVGEDPRLDKGRLGVENRLDPVLVGESGSISYTRDSLGRPLWMERGQVHPATPGDDVQLSIDLEIQRLAFEELTRGVEEADAAGGRCVVFDPLTGEILAMVDISRDLPELEPYPWPNKAKCTEEEKKSAAEYDAWRTEYMSRRSDRLRELGLSSKDTHRYLTMASDPARASHPAMARNRCVEDVYEPGSTFKAFVWSVITELGLHKLNDTIDTENGKWYTPFGRYIEDVHKAGSMTWAEVLVNSSNIGMIKGASKLTFVQLHDACTRFGFGKSTGVELPGEASGIVTPIKSWTIYSQSSVAHGYEVAVTPLQMVRAFSAFARPGDLAGTLPQVHLRSITPEQGSHAKPRDFQRGVIYRVLPPDVALTTREVMARVAENAESKMKDTPEGGWRYPMFGKSGTAEIPMSNVPKGKRKPPKVGYFDGQYNSSFIASGPTKDPRIVVLVVIDDPGPSKIRAKQHYGSWVAAPVVRRVMERSLTYLGVEQLPRATSTALAQ